MPSSMNIARGLVAAAALSTLSCGESNNARHVSVVVESASGLKPRMPVEIAGVQVGEVEKIRLEGWKARVFLRVDPSVDLKDDCLVRVDAKGLLGDRVINLERGYGAPVREGGELRAAPQRDVAIASKAVEVLERVDATVANVEAITKALRDGVEKEGAAALRPMFGDAPAKR